MKKTVTKGFSAIMAAAVFVMVLALSSACAPGSVPAAPSATSSAASWNTRGNPYDPTQTGWNVTRDEAIAYASTFLPASVVATAEIEAGRGWTMTGEPEWWVSFWGISVEKSELGWGNNYTETYGAGPYNNILIQINASNGMLHSRRASVSFRTPRPPSN